MADISLYEWLKGHDVLTWLEPLWESNKWFLNKDGKLEPNRTQAALETPWIHHGHQERLDCVLGQIVFNHVSKRMKQFFADGGPFVPSGCQNCYKVVVRPKTLAQLFALDELQEKMGHPSKCGIELRSSVGALYGGYFYNQGMKDGILCYAKVRKAVNENEYLGPEVGVILKRACTEMEHEVGPSDKWVITPEQIIMEGLIKEKLILGQDLAEQPEIIKWRTKRKWIEYAFQNGDDTYKKFTGGQSITPGYITYHGG